MLIRSICSKMKVVDGSPIDPIDLMLRDLNRMNGSMDERAGVKAV